MVSVLFNPKDSFQSSSHWPSSALDMGPLTWTSLALEHYISLSLLPLWMLLFSFCYWLIPLLLSLNVEFPQVSVLDSLFTLCTISRKSLSIMISIIYMPVDTNLYMLLCGPDLDAHLPITSSLGRHSLSTCLWSSLWSFSANMLLFLCSISQWMAPLSTQCISSLRFSPSSLTICNLQPRATPSFASKVSLKTISIPVIP